MTCIEDTAWHLAIKFRSIHNSSWVRSLLCVTPTRISQFPKTPLKPTPLKLPLSVLTYQQRTPVCLFGNKGKSENTDENAMEESMESLKKELSVQDLLKQQMEEEEFTDDYFDLQEISDGGGGGGGDGNRPGGGGGGSGYGFGPSDEQGFSWDELLQVALATIGLVLWYIYILDSEEINAKVRRRIKWLLTEDHSTDLKRLKARMQFYIRFAAYKYGLFYESLKKDSGKFFQSLSRKPGTAEPIKRWEEERDEVIIDALQSAILLTRTEYDSPEKLKRCLLEEANKKSMSLDLDRRRNLAECVLWGILSTYLKFNTAGVEDSKTQAGERMLRVEPSCPGEEEVDILVEAEDSVAEAEKLRLKEKRGKLLREKLLKFLGDEMSAQEKLTKLLLDERQEKLSKLQEKLPDQHLRARQESKLRSSYYWESKSEEEESKYEDYGESKSEEDYGESESEEEESKSEEDYGESESKEEESKLLSSYAESESEEEEGEDDDETSGYSDMEALDMIEDLKKSWLGNEDEWEDDKEDEED